MSSFFTSGISSGFSDAPWPSSVSRISGGYVDVEPHTPDAEPSAMDDGLVYDPHEHQLRIACYRALCSENRCDRAPMSFGLQALRLHVSKHLTSALILNLRYVDVNGLAFATNDPMLYDPDNQRKNTASMSQLLDQDGWVMPLRPYTFRTHGTRARVILSSNLTPRHDLDHVTLMLMEGDLSHDCGNPLLGDPDLGALTQGHLVYQDQVSITLLEYNKRKRNCMQVAPVPIYGAACSAGCVTVCLDDLWDDIYAALKVAFMRDHTKSDLYNAIVAYDAYTASRRRHVVHLTHYGTMR